jgi:putative intracellular protease/amidase
LLKKSLMAAPEAIAAYREMEQSPEFQNPISYEQAQAEAFDGLLIPGGHDKGVRELLESAKLQRMVAYFFDRSKPVAAICHGLLLLARSHSVEDPERVGRDRAIWICHRDFSHADDGFLVGDRDVPGRGRHALGARARERRVCCGSDCAREAVMTVV